MLLQQSAFRTDRMFVAIMIVIAFSLIMFSLIVLLEKWCVRWQNDSTSNSKGGIDRA
jgi:ABC-type nitrate/sulfonate/bicarbonate transport system permease component